MLITQASSTLAWRPAGQAYVPGTGAEKAPEPKEIFDRPSEALMTISARNPEAAKAGAKVAKSVGGAVLGGALGAYAGSHTGLASGLAGAAVLAIPGGLVGAIGAGVLAEQLGTSGSDTAGAAILGGVVGALSSMVGGYYLGSHLTGAIASIGLGIAGAAAGAYFAYS
jgi:hypothetical protein